MNFVTTEKCAHDLLDKIAYKQDAKSLRATDGGDWHLDLSEFTWM